MKKITTNTSLAGPEIKSGNPRSDAPNHSAQQPELEKRSKDPSSTCNTSSRYPIPSLYGSRIWDRA